MQPRYLPASTVTVMLRPSDLAVPHTLARLLPVLPAPPVRLVEVGGGDGALAAALRERGYAVTVVEPGAAGAQACRDRGVPVVQAPVEQFDGAGYGGVLFTRVLHALADPAAAVRRMAAACVPGAPVVVEDFARDEVDQAAAAFVYDGRAVLIAAGLLPPDPAGDPGADPLARWREFPIVGQPDLAGDPVAPQPTSRSSRDHADGSNPDGSNPPPPRPPSRLPVHPGSAVLAAVAALGRPPTVQRTEALWRHVLTPASGDATRLWAAAEVLRTVELRRIADGTLPAVGIFAVTAAS